MKLCSNFIWFLILAWMITGQCFSKDHIESSKVDSGARSLLLMSDIHFDPFADPQLVKSLIASPVEQWEGILASVPNEPFAPYGKDSNYALMISALTAARDRGPYKLAIITGDYLVHDSRKLFEPFGGKDEQAYENFVTKTEIFVAREVQKQLGNTPVYFSLGNNDSECGDYMMATHTKFLEALAAEWKVLKDNPEAQKTMAEAGYYEMPHPSLDDTRLVVLNDIYWSNRYEPDSCYSRPNDKAGDREMAWLKTCLVRARNSRQKVILVMHIPPQVDIFNTLKAMTTGGKKKVGKFFWDKKYEKIFVNLMMDYSDTVVFAYAGHTHMDDFRLLNNRQGNPFLVTHLCPAVSPIRVNNPGFQVMRFDKSTGEVRDVYTYYLKNLSSARGTGGQWGMEYDFDSAYGLEAYNAHTLKALTDRFDADNVKLSLFAKYYIVSAPEVITAKTWRQLNDLRLLASQKELDASLENGLK
ncbi:MAG TPA: metallophosphoesterase [bacterium]|nr:metallophosphoesterase [bacterium]